MQIKTTVGYHLWDDNHFWDWDGQYFSLEKGKFFTCYNMAEP